MIEAALESSRTYVVIEVRSLLGIKSLTPLPPGNEVGIEIGSLAESQRGKSYSD